MNTYMAMFMDRHHISLLGIQIGSCLNYIDAKATSLLAIFRSKQGFFQAQVDSKVLQP